MSTHTLANAGLPQPTDLVSIKPMFGTNYIDVRSHGYSDAAARENAKTLADMLLLVGVKAGYGVDLTQGQLAFGDAAVRDFYQQSKTHLIPDNGGLTIYEEPAYFRRVGAQVSVSEDALTFDHQLGQIRILKLPITERQRIAAELINDTYFEPSLNAVFVLSITAVEALCPEKAPSTFFQSAVSALIALIKSAHWLAMTFRVDKNSADLDELIKKLEGIQKRGSVRQGYMTKFRTLFDNERAKEFDDLYDRRSKFVHAGIGRGSFTQAAPRARQIATELLFADIATNP